MIVPVPFPVEDNSSGAACLGHVWNWAFLSFCLYVALTATEYGRSGGGGAGFLVGLRADRLVGMSSLFGI